MWHEEMAALKPKSDGSGMKSASKKRETTEWEVGSSLTTPSTSGLLLYFSVFIRAGAAAPAAAAAPAVAALVLLGVAAGCSRRRLLLLLLQRRRLLLLLRVALHVSAAALHLVEHPAEGTHVHQPWPLLWPPSALLQESCCCSGLKLMSSSSRTPSGTAIEHDNKQHWHVPAQGAVPAGDPEHPQTTHSISYRGHFSSSSEFRGAVLVSELYMCCLTQPGPGFQVYPCATTIQLPRGKWWPSATPEPCPQSSKCLSFFHLTLNFSDLFLHSPPLTIWILHHVPQVKLRHCKNPSLLVLLF